MRNCRPIIVLRIPKNAGLSGLVILWHGFEIGELIP